MKKYMVLAKHNGQWVHLALWNDAGEDDVDGLVSHESAMQVALDWTASRGQECRIVAVA